MSEEQRAEFAALLPKWQQYKRTLAWTFTADENAVITRLAFVCLNRKLTTCPSCKVDAMRQLENLYGI
jgi:hypothetical protein